MTERTVVAHTICPAKSPSAPIATAIGYEATAVGAANTTIIAHKL